MVNMDTKLDTWKNKLLDMGKRNRLLNYRDTRRSNLRIKLPGIYDLWDSFVVNEHPLEFPFVDEEQQLSLEEESGDFIAAAGSVQTNQSIKEQQRTLRNLRSKAKTFMEEQGVNVLYLSFGFLRWAESDHSKVHFDAPLILVPVSLSWESITSPFVLSLHEDEIIVNPTLAYKLDNDFGIKLPEFNIEDSLPSYFEHVCQLTSANHWEVIPEVGLGLLSFLKINMYRDLENHREAILKNPIVRALGGDASAVDHDLSVIDRFDHDNNTTPEHTFQVVDADASQQDAILCAKKGYSFVLQGPPGTGKSQTITNIIAECLADGKKVLFVSEKMAALEVVHKRLKDAGLADFCLILHSYKANKKDTLAQLGSVLSLASQKATLSDDAYQRLAQLTADRNRLNAYSTAIFIVIEPLHKTIYEANGILANLTDYADIIFPIEDIQQVTPQMYASYINGLTRFADTVSGMNTDYQNNPWYGANVKFVSNELRHDILARLNRLVPMIKEISELGNTAMAALSISAEISYSTLTQAAIILELAGRSPKVPLSWLTGDREIAQLLSEIQEGEKAQAAFLAQRKTILTLHQDILRNDSTADFTNFNSLATTAEIDAHIEAINTCIMSSCPCYAIWSGLANQSMVTALYDSAKEQIKAYNTIQQEIAQAYENEIFSIDFDAMYLRFKVDYTPEFNALKQQYETDKKLIQSLSREQATDITDESIFEILRRLQDMSGRCESELFSSDFNSMYLRFKSYYTPEFKALKLQYDADKKLIQSLSRELRTGITVEEVEEILGQLQGISEKYEAQIFFIDFNSIYSRFKSDYTSILKNLKPKYYADKKLIQNLYRIKDSTLTDAAIVELLENLQLIAKKYEAEIFSIDFTSMYQRFKTDYSSEFRTTETQYCKDRDLIQSFCCTKRIPLTDAEITELLGNLRWIAEKYEAGIFSIDFNSMYQRFKTNYSSEFKTTEAQHYKDRKLIQKFGLKRGAELTDDEMFELLWQLRRMAGFKKWMDENAGSLVAIFGKLYQAENTDFDELKRFLDAYDLMQTCLENLGNLRISVAENEAQASALHQHYKSFYSGLETDWAMARKALNWAIAFHRTMDGYNGYGETFLRYVCTSDEKIDLCKTYSDQIKQSLACVAPDFEWFLELFQSPDEWRNMPMPILTDRLTKCVNNLAALEEWIDFRTVRSHCYELGLEEYIRQIETLHIDSASIVPIFQKRFFRLWLDSVLPEYPIVANFRRKAQETVIQEFEQLDKLQFAIARSRIRSKLINGLPSLDHFTSGVDEISTLKRELNKQRRIMPIRRLFRTIPNLILALKPCLMMSPLSVSLFLEADTFTFDTVIFDEASQVCTENAIGAILRGKQVIIAGDSKQLPPTNFFSATVSDSDFDGDIEDEDEYDDSSAYESILDEAALLPERTLLWHYRSRHEHLIAFSNTKIYKGNLITFPSNVDRAPNVGVEYTYVPSGYYDRGGRKGNVIEAEKVVDLIFEHIRQFPNRSLGVIAFGEVQQLAIDTVLRKRRMENQQYESFFDEDRQEAFFVKSLENVQGDERDIIIFSIGYAKDASGVMRMNFGPLSKTGGERRLNVAITRAKYNVKLVGSILPTDINTERVSADGPKLLRGYIDFAINGPAVLQNEITESDFVQHDSPFEAAVYNFLDRKGYKLATQVGCSGYRIDMAVKHPKLSGRYVLGIECDGASYHSARTARERDRLRQDVLESMGWKIYRIWSTDWIKDPVTEGQRLIEAVDNAINSYIEAMPEAQAPTQQETSDVAEPFMTVEDKPVAIADITNPYGFDLPNTTDFSTLPRNRSGYLQLADCIELLVHNEYPIHYELLCQKLSPLLGREKATSVVRKEVDYALRSMGERVVRKGDFFYPASFTEIPVRQANGRNIKHISTDELAAAMLRVLKKCVGTTRAALIDETTRAFGFNRRGVNITKAMNEAFDSLLYQGQIAECDGKITKNGV